MKTEPNSLAYPGSAELDPGLSKRELFAAMAMQGFIQSNAKTGSFSQMAEDAVLAADALIKWLNEPPRQ